MIGSRILSTALFLGIQKALDGWDLIKTEFLRAYTENWSNAIAFTRNTDWETIIATCSVSQTASIYPLRLTSQLSQTLCI